MLTFFAQLYLYFVAFTSRIRLLSDYEEAILVLRESRPVVYSFWYQNTFFLLYYFGSRQMSILMTPIGKTDLLTKLSARMGLSVAKGSLEGGGRHALVTLMEHLRAGHSVLIPADGPLGPEKKCKASSILVAQETHSTLIPVSWYSKLRLKWPRKFNPVYIPLPFTTIEIHLGQPIGFSPHSQHLEELDHVKTQLTQKLEVLI